MLCAIANLKKKSSMDYDEPKNSFLFIYESKRIVNEFNHGMLKLINWNKSDKDDCFKLKLESRTPKTPKPL